MKILFLAVTAVSTFISIASQAASLQIIGLGATHLEALIDAKTELLALNSTRHFTVDPKNSPVIDCADRSITPHLKKNGILRCDYQQPLEMVKVSLPIVEILANQ